jgi:hypothetical protein
MAPKHDEIQHLDDGFTVAWDSTKTDAATIREIEKVVRGQASELGRIFDAGIVLQSGGKKMATDVKTTKATSRRRSRQPTRKSR